MVGIIGRALKNYYFGTWNSRNNQIRGFRRDKCSILIRIEREKRKRELRPRNIVPRKK